jgi:hypothetical protein
VISSGRWMLILKDVSARTSNPVAAEMKTD